MESVCAAILRAFNLKERRVTRDKAGYVCATDAGMVDVLRVGQTAERIWFRYHVQEHLHAHGFAGAERLRLSAAGEPFTVYDRETYVVRPHLPYREVSFVNEEEWRRVLHTVGRMHACLRDTVFEYTPRLPVPDVTALYQKNTDALIGTKRRILKKGKYAEFDVLFLRMVDEQTEALAEWYSLACSTAYATQWEEARTRRFVCHNLLKEENLLSAMDGVYVRNFAECAPGHHMDDLAALLRRYVAAVPDAPVPLAESLALYQAENPLAPDAQVVLRAALLFPDKFLKLSAKYYDRNRTWTPGAFTARMEEVARGQIDVGRYIR